MGRRGKKGEAEEEEEENKIIGISDLSSRRGKTSQLIYNIYFK